MKKRVCMLLAMVVAISAVASYGIPVFEFDDIDYSQNPWYAEGVTYVAEWGIMAGTGNGMFKPEGQITKAMFAQMLYALAGTNETNLVEDGVMFDVSAGEWYTDACKWALFYSIADIDGLGNFEPNKVLRRDEFVAMLFAYAHYRGYNVEGRADVSGYTDFETVGYPYQEQMKWAIYEGMISGTSATTISPELSVTRAQAAVIMMNFTKKFN